MPTLGIRPQAWELPSSRYPNRTQAHGGRRLSNGVAADEGEWQRCAVRRRVHRPGRDAGAIRQDHGDRRNPRRVRARGRGVRREWDAACSRHEDFKTRSENADRIYLPARLAAVNTEAQDVEHSMVRKAPK